MWYIMQCNSRSKQGMQEIAIARWHRTIEAADNER